jgi:glycosyltransferase involved in cell wall biosynthesis
LRYFLRRCSSEGRSKAILSRLVGSNDALASERSYVRRTLPAGLRAGARDLVRGDLGGLARAMAIVLGLATTAAGYVRGRGAAALRPARRRPAAAVSRSDAEGTPRVLMVTPRFPPDLGGVERHVLEVSRRLVGLGCNVSVLCTDRTGTLPDVDERDGLLVRRVRAWPSRHDYYIAPGLWRAMGRGRWDVVHVQSYHTFVAPLAMLRARTLGIPFVLTFHGGGHSSSVRRSLRAVQRRTLRPLVRRAARLIAVARFEIPLYAREFGVPAASFALIPNGTDLGSPSRPDVSTESVVVASIGRLERYKGHHRVVAAWPHVLRARPDACLWIVGTGPEAGALEEQAEQLGIAHRVVLRSTPSGDVDAMTSLLHATSLVVCMSDFETHPLAALEAAAAGCPLLVADNSGLRELVDDGLARAVSTDADPRALADAILAELDREHLPGPVELPSWDDCATRLRDLYLEVSCGS